VCICLFVLRHENLAFSLLVYVKTFGKPHDLFISAGKHTTGVV
jgi:hypothetical protein